MAAAAARAQPSSTTSRAHECCLALVRPRHRAALTSQPAAPRPTPRPHLASASRLVWSLSPAHQFLLPTSVADTSLARPCPIPQHHARPRGGRAQASPHTRSPCKPLRCTKPLQSTSMNQGRSPRMCAAHRTSRPAGTGAQHEEEMAKGQTKQAEVQPALPTPTAHTVRPLRHPAPPPPAHRAR